MHTAAGGGEDSTMGKAIIKSYNIQDSRLWEALQGSSKNHDKYEHSRSTGTYDECRSMEPENSVVVQKARTPRFRESMYEVVGSTIGVKKARKEDYLLATLQWER